MRIAVGTSDPSPGFEETPEDSGEMRTEDHPDRCLGAVRCRSAAGSPPPGQTYAPPDATWLASKQAHLVLRGAHDIDSVRAPGATRPSPRRVRLP